jgi:hypothetical protein
VTAAACAGLAIFLSAQEASALDVQQIRVYEGAFFTNGVITNYFWGVNVKATGMDNGTVQVVNTGASYPLVHSISNPNHWGIIQTFTSFANDTASHPIPCNNTFFFNQKPGGSYEDNVTLGYDPGAGVGGFAHITFPTHNAMGMPLNPTYQWDSVLGYGQDLGLFVNLGANSILENLNTISVYNDVPDSDMTKTWWQPGPLAASTKYELEVFVMNMDPTTSASTVKGDAFTYYGMRGMDNHVDFMTAIPEPISMMLVGTATLTVFGVRRRRRMT